MEWVKNIPSKFVKNKKIIHDYRVFKNLYNIHPPYSIYKNKKVINWSNNDYNGITQNDEIKKSLIRGIKNFGCGSSGTRNIGGTNQIHNQLESKISKLHGKENGLIFNSGYMANLSCMEAMGKIFPKSEFFSDRFNHNSLINGIKLSGSKKFIFNHNDAGHLEYLLKKSSSDKKIIVIESMYSIDGTIPPFHDIIYLKKKYNSLLFVDEIHAVGVHGDNGMGITEKLNIQNEIDVIMGGFGKGYGIIGGYLCGEKNLIDAIRLCGSGFIFTTSLPPHIILGIIHSIDYNIENSIKNQKQRIKTIDFFKKIAHDKKIPLIQNYFCESQIQSIFVGCPLKAEKMHNTLLEEHYHYVQHLNFPTVAEGNERLRLSLKTTHSEKMILDLLSQVELFF